MTDLKSPRLGLPLLAVAQAHKEATHNEALNMLEFMAHRVIEDVENDPDAIFGAAEQGQAWIVGNSPVGEWAGHGNQLALLTAGGWSFIQPVDGLVLLSKAQAAQVRYTSNTWIESSFIDEVSGGSTIDVNARDTLNALIRELRTTGQIKAAL